ncbi:MAG: hypothetical protein FADNKDHG_01595 [Holosporales bacterium]
MPRERKKHPMKKEYHHLTQEERAQIYALKKQGVTQMANRRVVFAKSSREIKGFEDIVTAKLMKKHVKGDISQAPPFQ